MHAVAFSPDGKHLAAASADGLIRIWDVATAKPVHALKDIPRRCVPSPIRQTALAWQPAATMPLRIWDPGRHRAAARSRRIPKPSTRLLSRPTATSSPAGGEKTVRTWLAKDGKEQIAYYGFANPPTRSSFAATARCWPPADVIAASALECRVGQDRAAVQGTPQLGARPRFRWIDADLRQRDQTIRFWDDWSGKTFPRVGGWDGEIHAIALARKNTLLITADGNGVIRFRDARIGTEVGHWPAPEAATSLAVSPDNALAASGSHDGSVIVWSLKDVELVEKPARWKGHAGAAMRR